MLNVLELSNERWHPFRRLLLSEMSVSENGFVLLGRVASPPRSLCKTEKYRPVSKYYDGTGHCEVIFLSSDSLFPLATSSLFANFVLANAHFLSLKCQPSPRLNPCHRPTDTSDYDFLRL